MSHAQGTVTFKDGEVWWFEYNGTSSFAIPDIYPTKEEMQANWRKGECKECTCGKLELATIEADYGRGIKWEGEACRSCKAINHEHLDNAWEWKKEEEELERQSAWGYFLLGQKKGEDK